MNPLVLLENGVVGWLAVSGDLNVGIYLVGLALSSAVAGLFGLGFILRYRSISEFILPSVLAVTLLILPILDQLQVVPGLAYWLHPMHGPIRLLDAAFRPHTALDIAASAILSMLWLAIAFQWCRSRLQARKTQW